MSCCGSKCSSCSGCCGGGCGGELFLTQTELELLGRFAQIPFLPVGSKGDREEPLYREEDKYTPAEYTQTLLWLKLKGLITIDYDLPLTGFDYANYADCRLKGSMALTAAGQRAIDLLEIQGMDEY